MNLKDYQKAALKTAMYPSDKHLALAYCTLGLCGEIAELMAPELDKNDAEAVLCELGDACWYVATLAYELGIDPDDLSYVVLYASNVSDEAPSMACHAGMLANKVKKVIRDGKEVDRDWAAHQLSEIIEGVAMIAECYDSTLASVLEKNIAKLRSRQERGVIQGSGDNR